MPQRYIDTTLFDLFKVGPGPSSSHTIGPMKAGHHFAETCAALPRDLLVRAVRFRVRLYGSLSATGTGHGTDAAVVAGLLGTAPESCPAGLLQELMDDPHTRRKRSLGDGQVSVCVDDVSHDAIIHDFPYSNTLVADLLDAEDKVLHSQEYYSVGGGFIQWKGWEPPSLGEPVHRYSNMTELRAIVKEKGLNIYEIILDNEMAITGASRPSIIYSLNQIIDHMASSVRRGLDSEGQLPGPLKVQRKARMLWQQASRMQSSPDQFLTRINAYAFATAEENASGGVIVTAPTCGSAGVLPAVLLPLARAGQADEEAVCDALYVAAGFGQVIAARATLAGAEGGCQAEVGAASAMAAAALCNLKGGTPEQCAAAAAMALGNLLGLVCDPVAGLVEVPCIKRNVVGAVNAVSCANMALAGVDYAIPCDEVIDAMGRVGSLLSPDLRETGQGGLAATPTGVKIARQLAQEDRAPRPLSPARRTNGGRRNRFFRRRGRRITEKPQ